MKKLHILGLMVLSTVFNNIAMEPHRARNPHFIGGQVHQQHFNRIGQAYERLNRIINNAYPISPTNWNAIFTILDLTPNIDINQYNTPDGETLLEYALEEKNFAAAKRLLQQYNADPHRVVHPGDKTPLQIALEWTGVAGADEMITMIEDYEDQWDKRERRETFAGG